MGNTNGYRWRYCPEHPAAMADGMLYEHREVAYDLWGEAIRGKHVHHLDGDRTNNAPENLGLLSAPAHVREHRPPRMMACAACGQWVPRKKRKLYCSEACTPTTPRKIEWPEVEVLAAMADAVGFSAAGRLLGVSDNAIRKRLRKHTRVAESA